MDNKMKATFMAYAMNKNKSDKAGVSKNIQLQKAFSASLFSGMPGIGSTVFISREMLKVEEEKKEADNLRRQLAEMKSLALNLHYMTTALLQANSSVAGFIKTIPLSGTSYPTNLPNSLMENYVKSLDPTNGNFVPIAGINIEKDLQNIVGNNYAEIFRILNIDLP